MLAMAITTQALCWSPAATTSAYAWLRPKNPPYTPALKNVDSVFRGFGTAGGGLGSRRCSCAHLGFLVSRSPRMSISCHNLSQLLHKGDETGMRSILAA